MKMRCVAVLALAALVPCLAAEEKADDALAKALKDADAVFTAKVGKVSPLGQTNSIPASIFGDVTFKDAKALRGTVPEAAKFSFSYREGAKHMDLTAEGQVLVAVKGKGVSAVVPATEANLALAKKAADGAKEK